MSVMEVRSAGRIEFALMVLTYAPGVLECFYFSNRGCANGGVRRLLAEYLPATPQREALPAEFHGHSQDTGIPWSLTSPSIFGHANHRRGAIQLNYFRQRRDAVWVRPGDSCVPFDPVNSIQSLHRGSKPASNFTPEETCSDQVLKLRCRREPWFPKFRVQSRNNR